MPHTACICVEIFIHFNPTSYTVTEGGATELVIEKVGTSEVPVTVTLSTHTGSASSECL